MTLDEPVYIDLELRNAFINESGFNPAECYQCGTCTATCPLNGIHEEKLTIRKILHRAQLGLPADPLVWKCSSCKLCEVRCPREVDIVGSFHMLRNYSYKKREMPREFEELLWNVLEEANPSGEAKSGRDTWMQGLNLKPAREAKTMFYVGGPAAYDPRLQKVAKRMIGIFDQSGVDFGVLGREEPSSGEAVYEIADDAFMDHMLTNNVQQFNKTGVDRIVTLSPHAYNIMKHVYPYYGLEIEVLHYTEFLDEIWNNDILKFSKKLEMEVTYHDPCYLGRWNGVYDAPRNLIEAIPGINLTEMDETKAQAICCGGGGNQIYKETEENIRLSDVRVRGAAKTGASAIITSCGYCIQNFEDSVKTTGKEMVINDLIELVFLGLEGN